MLEANKVNGTDLEGFFAAAKEKTQADLGYEVGQRYARVFYDYNNKQNRSVYCFVDLTNGNVLRPDGWRRPNLKVRNSIQGNIYDEQKGCGNMRPSGTDYLKQLNGPATA
jgi:hypothetical protein